MPWQVEEYQGEAHVAVYVVDRQRPQYRDRACLRVCLDNGNVEDERTLAERLARLLNRDDELHNGEW